MMHGVWKWRRWIVAAACMSAAFLSRNAYAQSLVLSVQPGKSVQTLAGNGTLGYAGDLAAATSANLALPTAVAYDAAGNLYIADANNHVIREVDTTGKISTVAGSGVQGFSGDGGLATSASLDTPTGVAVDQNQNLYIADSHNQRIRIVSNGMIHTFAGNGVAGFSGDGGAATSANLLLPTGVAVDTAGNVYIADTNNNRIRKVSGGVITTVAGDGEQIYSGDNGLATAAGLDSPAGVAVDASGNIYIADRHNQTVRKVDTLGNISTVAGNNIFGFTGDGGTATHATLADPTGVTVDAQGDVYIADSRNNVIREISNGVINTIAGTGIEAYSSSSGPASSAVFDTPSGVALNASGDVAVADQLNQIVAAVNLPTLSFGSQAVGTSGAAQSITLSNSGTSSLEIQTISISSNYQIASGGTCSNLPITLTAGSSCTLSIDFAPTTVGVTNGSITLNGASITPQTLLLSGTGTQGTDSLQLGGNFSTVYGSGTLTAALSSGSQVATGSITFLEGSTVLASAALNNDVANLSLSMLSVGTHVITAAYSGDANYAAVTSAPVTVTVTPLQLTANVAAVASLYGQAIPSITGTLLGVLAQDSGKVAAVFSTSATATSPVGTYPITVSLTGISASNYTVQLSSSGTGSGAAMVTILQAGTVTTLSANSAIAGASSNVTFTALVSSQTTGVPSGSVNFYDGTTLLGNGTVGATGTASYTTSFAVVAQHVITAVYSGDVDFTASTSSPVTESIVTPAFTITANPTTLIMQQGKTGAIILTVTPKGGYSGTVTFNCSGLPAYTTCLFNPTSIVLNGSNAPQTTTLSVYTLGANSYANNSGPVSASNPPLMATIFWLPIGLISGFFAIGRKRVSARIKHLLVLAIFAYGALGLSGCGARSLPYTPTGTSTVTIQAFGAVAAAGGQNVSENATVTIVITKPQ